MPTSEKPYMPTLRELHMRHLSGEPSPLFLGDRRVLVRAAAYAAVASRASSRPSAPALGNGEKRVPEPLSRIQKLMQDSEERALAFGAEPAPMITLDHVTVRYTRTGGPGGQHVNKVNTKVDMRFNVKNACWLRERVRQRILQMEGICINKNGEIVVSSTKSIILQYNIQDALRKLQEIIDTASYAPPPPSEETKEKIKTLSAAGEHKRLHNKKVHSQKKVTRRGDICV